MKNENINFENNLNNIRTKQRKAPYSSHLIINRDWIKQWFDQPDRYVYGSRFHCYPFAMNAKFAIFTSQEKEQSFFHKLLKLESDQTLNEEAQENNDVSNDFLKDGEKETASRRPRLEKSLRKYFTTEVFSFADSGKERHLHTEHELKKSLIDFTAGSLAGIAQIYTSQPFDTVKVKQQTFPKLYSSMLKCFLHTYRRNGIVRGLYAGTVPAAVSSIAENSVLFTAYGASQKVVTFIMEIDRVEELSALGNACAGFLAAFFSSFTMCPTELIKCRLQAVHEMKHYVEKRSTAMPITTFKLTKDIFVNEGIRGFYRGLSSTIAREMPGYFFFFGSYEATREFFVQPNQTKNDIGPLRTMCAGAIGGIAAWTSTYPIDVIKTRIQISNLKGSMLTVGSDILRKEGVFAFYSGLLPTILRTIPATATLFLVYEYSKKVLTEKFL